ncbi:MAG: hypothetical protein K6F67_05115 [Oscillospiraceae bacterium]|nr:hypothetical protein [Oscillospiraceae bacterium]
MRKKPVFALVISLVVPALLLLSGCEEKQISGIERIESITGYVFSDDTEEVYSFQDDTWVGCAGQYSVFRTDEEPDCIPNDSDKPYSISEAAIDNIMRYLERHNIPEEYYPDFEEKYTYTTGKEETFIFYFPESNMLKIWMGGHWKIQICLDAPPGRKMHPLRSICTPFANSIQILFPFHFLSENPLLKRVFGLFC